MGPVTRCERLPVDGRRPDPRAVGRGAAEIRRGGVIAAPTDTLYGLLADARSERAVRRVFRIKGRDPSNPILLLIDSMARLRGLVSEAPPALAPLAARFWPGPLTLVLPARAEVPLAVTAGTGTVAVRLPRSPLVRALAARAGCPLTGTSANRSGRAGARSGAEVAAQLGGRLPLLLDGGPASRLRPSTVLDLCGAVPAVLREGCVDPGEIRRALRGAEGGGA